LKPCLQQIQSQLSGILPGNESFPSPIPRSLRMTEMKWIQDEWNRGRAFEVVRCFTSAVDMLPITLFELSTTATLVKHSLLISCNASARVLSPLE